MNSKLTVFALALLCAAVIAKELPKEAKNLQCQLCKSVVAKPEVWKSKLNVPDESALLMRRCHHTFTLDRIKTVSEQMRISEVNDGKLPLIDFAQMESSFPTVPETLIACRDFVEARHPHTILDSLTSAAKTARGAIPEKSIIVSKACASFCN